MKFVKYQNLMPGMELEVGITDVSGNVVFKRRTKLTERNIDYINKKGYQGVYIYDSKTEEMRLKSDFTAEKLTNNSGNIIKRRDFAKMIKLAYDISDAVENGIMRRIEILNIQPFEDYDYYHALNTAVYSAVMGRKLGIIGVNLKLLVMAGIMHDIGMAYIPSSITEKNGKLTEEEYERVKEHTELGLRALQGRSIPNPVLEAIRYHHENINGTGYPLKLSGESIPVFSRIIHVADVLDAMTTRRPYKDAYFAADALDYIKEGSGILFDSKVVDAALECFEAYPLGIDVELTNNKNVWVFKHTKNYKRPVVFDEAEYKFINLAEDPEYKSLSIKSGRFGQVPANNSGNAKTGVISNVKTHLFKTKKIPTDGITRETVMVVDDSTVNRKLVKAALDGNYKVLDFASGAEFMQFVRKYGISDVVIMDIEMPGMNGLKTVEKLKELGYTKTPVIFMSAVNDRRTVVKCKMVGAVDYILKPAKPIYIYERVNAALMKSSKIND